MKEKEEEFKMYSHFKKEFILMKNRFTQLSEFIKDVRFRVNLEKEVKRRDYYHISSKIDFTKKQEVEGAEEMLKKEIENKKREEMLLKVIEEINNQEKSEEKNEEKKDDDSKIDNNINNKDINTKNISNNNINTNNISNNNINCNGLSDNNINANKILNNDNTSSLEINKDKEINIKKNKTDIENNSKKINNLKKNYIDINNKKNINTDDNNYNTNIENQKIDIPKISTGKLSPKKNSPKKISPGKDNKKAERKNSKNTLIRNSPKKTKIYTNIQNNKAKNSIIEDKKLNCFSTTSNPIKKEKEKIQRNFSAFTNKERTVNSLIYSTNYNKNTNLKQKLISSNSTGDINNFPNQKITIDSTRKSILNNNIINNIENDNSIDASKSKNFNKNESSIFLRQKQPFANIPQNENNTTQIFVKIVSKKI